ncbi:MAG: methyltransferase [Chlorobiaceae bacterium]|nr:methyltransferase [Chlorobiaceae bacterium]
MAETRISDVIVPEVFAPYVINETVEKSVLFQSGIVTADSRVEIGSRNGGETINMPYWNDLDGEAEELSDQKALTVNKIDAGQDIAVLQALGKAFGANDLAGALAGDDPVRVIASRVGEFWGRNMGYRLKSQLTGIFAAANMSGNVLDISALSAGAAVIDKSSFADAIFKLGDHADQLTAVAMHSDTYKVLYKADLIDEAKPSEGKMFETYQGKRILIDDTLAGANGVYTTYLFGQGAFGYAEGTPKVPVETDRDSLSGIDILISRRHFVMHPRGVKWVGTATVSTGNASAGHPTRTELATGTNWTRVYDPKKIRIVAFKHRVAAAG